MGKIAFVYPGQGTQYVGMVKNYMKIIVKRKSYLIKFLVLWILT